MSAPIVPPAANDLLRVSYRCFQNGQLGEITCGYLVQSVGGGGLSVQQIANELTTLSDAQWPAVLPPTAHTLGTTVELISRIVGRVTQSAAGPDNAVVGVVGTVSSPAVAGAIIRKHTGLAGRSMRGRVYMPFVPADFLSDMGELTVAARAVYLTFGNAIITTLALTVGAASTTIQPTIIHAYRLGGPGLPVDDQLVLSIDVPGTLGNQHRRGDYGHRNADF